MGRDILLVFRAFYSTISNINYPLFHHSLCVMEDTIKIIGWIRMIGQSIAISWLSYSDTTWLILIILKLLGG